MSTRSGVVQIPARDLPRLCRPKVNEICCQVDGDTNLLRLCPDAPKLIARAVVLQTGG